jgi:hypothetical protein
MKYLKQANCLPKYVFYLPPIFLSNKYVPHTKKTPAPKGPTAPRGGGQSLRTSGIIYQQPEHRVRPVSIYDKQFVSALFLCEHPYIREATLIIYSYNVSTNVLPDHWDILKYDRQLHIYSRMSAQFVREHLYKIETTLVLWDVLYQQRAHLRFEIYRYMRSIFTDLLM